MHQIARHSTIVTRKAWAADRTVARIAENLKRDMTGTGAMAEDVVILALAALRWLEFQAPEEQRAKLESAVARLVAEHWGCSAATLARLLWLDAPLGLSSAGAGRCLVELRQRHRELGGRDVTTVIAAVRGRVLRRSAAADVGALAAASPGEAELLRLLEAKLTRGGMRESLSAEEIAETAEALAEMRAAPGVHRALARELHVRRQDLPDSVFRRTRRALEKAGVKPPSTAWDAPGAMALKRRPGREVVTTQTFATHGGHAKTGEMHSKRARRDDNRNFASTSPVRYVADWVRASY